MSDNDIKKALECCADELRGCEDCPFSQVECIADTENSLMKSALDLINRQQAEIERYLHSIKLLEKDVADAKAELSEFKAMTVNQIADMAIKAFAEKAKNRIVDSTYPSFDKEGKPILVWKASGYKEIDNLVKEMTEL